MICLLWLMTCCLPARADAPNVVVSIKPIHSLVAAIMREVGTPVLLLESSYTPHAYALKPSDAQRLADARLVVWIGPQLESFLARPLAALSHPARLVRLIDAPGIDPLPLRGVHDHGETTTGGRDPHFWLDPLRAIAAADVISDALIAADPPNAARYRHNRDELKMRLRNLHEDIERKLAPLRDATFVVFHDAYQYLEQRYKLKLAAFLTIDPELAPGAARLRTTRDIIRDASVSCVFAEPQFQPRLIGVVAEGLPVRVGTLDPLGLDINAGVDAYFRLMTGLAANLADCLAAK